MVRCHGVAATFTCQVAIATNGKFTKVMRPYAESPIPTGNEVRVVIRNPQVIYRLPFACVEYILDRHPLAVMAQEQIVDFQFVGSHPSLVPGKERMLRGRHYHMAVDMQVQDLAGPHENFFNLLAFQLPGWIVFPARQDQVANLEFLNRLRAIGAQQERKRTEKVSGTVFITYSLPARYSQAPLQGSAVLHCWGYLSREQFALNPRGLGAVLFPGPALRAKCLAQMQALRRGHDPAVVAKRPAPLCTQSQCLQFRRRLRFVDHVRPVFRVGQGPGTEQARPLIRRMHTLPQAAPGPLLRTVAHELRPQTIALDVAAYGVEMVILLDRKRFEPALVEMARADVVVMGVPALRVRQGEPGHEARQVPALVRPQDQVPVVGQQAIGQDAHRHLRLGLAEHALKRSEIAGLVQERTPGVATVQHVVDQPAFSDPQHTSHSYRITMSRHGTQADTAGQKLFLRFKTRLHC